MFFGNGRGVPIPTCGDAAIMACVLDGVGRAKFGRADKAPETVGCEKGVGSEGWAKFLSTIGDFVEPKDSLVLDNGGPKD